MMGIVATTLALLGASSAQALTLEPVGGTFAEPTYVTSDPSDASRLFVVERKGTIQLLENGVKSKFADIGAEVGCGASCEGERGLMSVAFDPGFESNGRLYVEYGNDLNGDIDVDELLSPGPDHDTAAFAKNLFTIPHPTKTNHYGGQLQFGPDGALYISTGDGGGENDLLHNSQSLSSQLGKILRLEVASPSPTPTIWSYGLRNPFRFSFDSPQGRHGDRRCRSGCP